MARRRGIFSMNLLDILTIDCIKAPLASANKQGAINELVDVLAAAGRVKDAGALKEAVWTREQTRTTGIGHGLAIPHGKSSGVDSLAMAIGKPATPMEFAAIDGKPVRLVVLLASPPDRTSDHIQALARISKLMTMEDFRERIYATRSPQEIYDLLKSQETPGKA
ncbi:MAG: PTS sugar transporter subunit IIA [Phycisphaerales bacterium]|nr:PTS sugar transporter subunit IIA [Phycisphaerales bacterium]